MKRRTLDTRPLALLLTLASAVAVEGCKTPRAGTVNQDGGAEAARPDARGPTSGTADADDAPVDPDAEPTSVADAAAGDQGAPVDTVMACASGRRCGDQCIADEMPCNSECMAGWKLCNGGCSQAGAKWCCDDTACASCERCSNSACVAVAPGDKGRGCEGVAAVCLAANQCGQISQRQEMYDGNVASGNMVRLHFEQIIAGAGARRLVALAVVPHCQPGGILSVELRDVVNGMYLGLNGSLKPGLRAGNRLLASGQLSGDVVVETAGREGKWAYFVFPVPVAVGSNQPLALVIQDTGDRCWAMSGKAGDPHVGGALLSHVPAGVQELAYDLTFREVVAP